MNKRLYTDLGMPSLCPNVLRDVGEELTSACELQGKSVKLWWPTSVEEPRWKLTDEVYFGIGTAYEGQFWHLFDSRHEANRGRFIAKCQEILAGAPSA